MRILLLLCCLAMAFTTACNRQHSPPRFVGAWTGKAQTSAADFTYRLEFRANGTGHRDGQGVMPAFGPDPVPTLSSHEEFKWSQDGEDGLVYASDPPKRWKWSVSDDGKFLTLTAQDGKATTYTRVP